MKQVLARNLLFLVVCGSLIAFLLAHRTGTDLELTVLIATVITLLMGITVERIIPHRKDWNSAKGDTKTDITSAVVLVGLVDPALKAIAPIVVVSILGAISVTSGTDFLSNLPLLVQILAAALVIEFGRYWSHRLHHMFKPLWWLHAMHHSSERLYTINNLRFHPVNYIINFILGMLPAMFLGFSTEALLGYLALTQPVLMLQHANIDLKSGWLNFVFSTNELHRSHHSIKSNEANSNFGNTLIIWDQIFGTFHYNCNEIAPSRVGLFAESMAYPGKSNYFTQLRSMFSPACCGA